MPLFMKFVAFTYLLPFGNVLKHASVVHCLKISEENLSLEFQISSDTSLMKFGFNWSNNFREGLNIMVIYMYYTCISLEMVISI